MSVSGWLVYEAEHAKKNQAFIDWFLEEAKKLNIELTFLLQSQITYGVRNSEMFLSVDNKEAKTPGFVIMRNIDPLFNLQLEQMRIPCFNSYHVSSICNDKARTYQFLAHHGIPMLESYFLNPKDLDIKNFPLSFPMVAKSRTGRGGEQVYLLEDKHDLQTLQESTQEDFIFQDLAPSPGKDLRVYVLGKEIVGAVLRKNEQSFKANYSLGGTAEAYILNQQERSLVEQIVKLFDFGLVGIDFLFDEHGSLLFNEIEDVVGCRTLCLTSDVNIVKLYLEFILLTLGEK